MGQSLLQNGLFQRGKVTRFLHRSTATKIAAPELILWGFHIFETERSRPMSCLRGDYRNRRCQKFEDRRRHGEISRRAGDSPKRSEP